MYLTLIECEVFEKKIIKNYGFTMSKSGGGRYDAPPPPRFLSH